MEEREDLTVWAISWVYWNGTDQGGGGFWWYLNRVSALEAFEIEKKSWAGTASRVRLVPITVPAHEAFFLDGQYNYDGITQWIDSDIDMIEHQLPAEKVAIARDGLDQPTRISTQVDPLTRCEDAAESLRIAQDEYRAAILAAKAERISNVKIGKACGVTEAAIRMWIKRHPA